MKKLKGREDQWRLRVGDWRIIFEIDAPGRVIYIVRVLPRKDAYGD
ncbi:MAG: type II toxin-antitoxin system RelE/ParE family toxin [Anaerolineae bacterium]|nr:type II toxin-antitoxin system RelE/ParE family toxin [Anaerolineae bacterium]